MRIGDTPLSALRGQLADQGLEVDFGLVRVRIRSDLPTLAERLQRLYGHYPLAVESRFCDVSVTLQRVAGLRRHLRAQVQLIVDGTLPFEPYPADTDLPLLEWGMNWCIAQRCHHVLLLHAGVVERAGAAILLPALPGSGKSTLTAALTLSGWRFLADEFGAVRLSDSALLPVVRPIGLKNESIEVIRAFSAEAVLGPSFPKTHKGTVAHVAANAASVAKRHEPARAVAVVFPKYAAGVSTELEEVPRARAFAKLAANSFNYELLGPKSFVAMGRLIEQVRCYRLTYSRLEEALAWLADLHEELRSSTVHDDGALVSAS